MIHYTSHLRFRLKTRNIPEELPKQIYRNSNKKYLDTENNNRIAVETVSIWNKERDMMIAYKKEDEDVYIITIHPLKENQLENRIQSRRWVKLDS